MANGDKMTMSEKKRMPNTLVMSNLSMTIDGSGQPSIALSTPLWVSSVFGACAYYVKQLFTKERDRYKEERSLDRFRMYLERLQARVSFDETGLPVFSVVLVPTIDPEPSARMERNTPVTDAKPIVVKRKKRTIIYNIQNITIDISSEVVTQLNMNPVEVVNHFHDQIEAAVDKAVKEGLPIERES